jgi:hypothetical protein
MEQVYRISKLMKRPSALDDQSGAPQASLDLDANRLESDEPENGEGIPL